MTSQTIIKPNTNLKTMSIISFSLRELPRFTEESPVGYYPVVANAGKFTPEQLYETVQNRCTVTSTDIVAVMDALVNVVAEKLSCGTSVEIPGLGYFSPMISCHRKISDQKRDCERKCTMCVSNAQRKCLTYSAS